MTEERLQQRIARIMVICQELTGTVSLKRLLHRIVGVAADLTASEVAGILLFDEGTSELRFVAATSSANRLLDIPVPIDASIAGAAFSSGKPVIVPEVRSDPRYYSAVEETIGLVARSLLAVPLQFQERRIGVLEVENKRQGEFDREDVEMLTVLAAQATVAIENTRLVEALQSEIDERKQTEALLRERSEQLRALTARLGEVEEAERRRLAGELHDQAGQNLTALGLNLRILRSQILAALDRPDRGKEMLARIDDSLVLLRQTTRRIRNVMDDLRPPALEEYGLVAALGWYGETFTSRTNVPVSLHGPEPAVRLPPLVEMAMFRIAQEALTNVARHAQASAVTVTVAVDGERARMAIMDNGTGFDPARVSQPKGRQHWGVPMMAERAEALGGTCRVESSPGEGTKVIVEVPL